MDEGGFSRGCGGDDKGGPEAGITLPSRPACARQKGRLASVLLRNEPISKEALLKGANTRVRKNLSKCGLTATDLFGIALSGGQCSMSLVAAMRTMGGNAKAVKSPEQWVAMFVDCSALTSLWKMHPGDPVEVTTGFAHAVSHDLGARLVVVPLQSLWEEDWTAAITEPGTYAPPPPAASPAVAAMQSLFARLPSVDTRQTLLEHLVLLGLRRAAHQLAISHVLLGDTTNRCAERVLGSVARGAGTGVALGAALLDTRWHVSGHTADAGGAGPGAGVIFVRPVGDAERKEVQLFGRWAGPEHMPGGGPPPYAVTPTFFTGVPPRTSTAQACAGLMAMLQGGFPSSAFNVLRTVAKLAPPAGLAPPPKPDDRARRRREADRVAAMRGVEVQGGGAVSAPPPPPNTAFVPCPLCGVLLNGVECGRAQAGWASGAPLLPDLLCYSCRSSGAWGGATLGSSVSGLPTAMGPDLLHAAGAGAWLALSPAQAQDALDAEQPMLTAESAAELARAPRSEGGEGGAAAATAKPMSRGEMEAAILPFLLLGDE